MTSTPPLAGSTSFVRLKARLTFDARTCTRIIARDLEVNMSLRERLTSDLKAAMRSGDETRKSTIRLLRAAVLNAEKEEGRQELTEEDVQAVIAQQAKQRRDSIAEYEKAGRDDLVAQEQAELDVIMEYLPRQLTEEEIEAAARAKIEEVGATSMAQMGDVMRPLMAEIGDRADGRLVNQIVRRLLSE